MFTTVNSVLFILNFVLNRLEGVEDKQRKRAGRKQREVAEAQREANEAAEEASRAARVRSKLNDLLS